MVAAAHAPTRHCWYCCCRCCRHCFRCRCNNACRRVWGFLPASFEGNPLPRRTPPNPHPHPMSPFHAPACASIPQVSSQFLSRADLWYSSSPCNSTCPPYTHWRAVLLTHGNVRIFVKPPECPLCPLCLTDPPSTRPQTLPKPACYF
jgi:hypothetical protein